MNTSAVPFFNEDKLKLSGGNIKDVQGDSGHAQAKMVLDLYSHITDEDRKRNATRLEEAFYQKKDLDPEIEEETFDAKMEAEQKMTDQQNATLASQQTGRNLRSPAASAATAGSTTSADTGASRALSASAAKAIPASPAESTGSGTDAATIARVLSNPQMMAILAAMSKAMSSNGNDN